MKTLPQYENTSLLGINSYLYLCIRICVELIRFTQLFQSFETLRYETLLLRDNSLAIADPSKLGLF
jgi:hypothetical protein